MNKLWLEEFEKLKHHHLNNLRAKYNEEPGGAMNVLFSQTDDLIDFLAIRIQTLENTVLKLVETNNKIIEFLDKK